MVAVTDAAKIELHVHLEATIRPATLLLIARRNGIPLPADTVEGIEALYRFRDFKHFIDVWVMTTNCLRTADDFRQVVVDYAEQAAGFGAVYLEGIFSPPERVLLGGLDWDVIYSGYTDGAAEAAERFGVTVRFTGVLPAAAAAAVAELTGEPVVGDRDVVHVVGAVLHQYRLPLSIHALTAG